MAMEILPAAWDTVMFLSPTVPLRSPFWLPSVSRKCLLP